MGMYDRTKILINDADFNKLQNSKVIIFGVGGVGGYVAEMLCRTGINNIVLVDYDTVSESNLNRQIIALNSTLNMKKVEVMKSRILDINKNVNVKVYDEKLTPENIDSFNLKDYDFVIDCIDMVKSKIALIKYCYDNKINIVSSMGTGNKKGIPNFKISDIYETKNDGLSKVLRHELKKLGVLKTNVVWTDEISLPSKEIGSLVYYPAMCGCVLSAFVIKKLTD